MPQDMLGQDLALLRHLAPLTPVVLLVSALAAVIVFVSLPAEIQSIREWIGRILNRLAWRMGIDEKR